LNFVCNSLRVLDKCWAVNGFLQTYEQLVSVFEPSRIAGVQEEVQLREQGKGYLAASSDDIHSPYSLACLYPPACALHEHPCADFGNFQVGVATAGPRECAVRTRRAGACRGQCALTVELHPQCWWLCCILSLRLQDPQGKQLEQAERLRFGRFYYRFPDVSATWQLCRCKCYLAGV
jgi:hypothetical protein